MENLNGEFGGNLNLAVPIMLVIILLIIVLKQRAALVLKIIVRGTIGGILIYIINEIFLWQSLSSIIVINPLTILTTAILGFPGILLLYAINFIALL